MVSVGAANGNVGTWNWMSTKLCIMAERQYDMSLAEQKKFQEIHKKRLELREEFQKQISNPHRHASQEGGLVVSN